MLKSLAFMTVVSMVCYFNPAILEKETTETFEDQGFQNYEYRHTFSSGTFDSPGSILDGCKKYTTINDVILYDYPEIHENYDTLVVSSDIASGYLPALQKKYGQNLSEYYLLCPLETTKKVDIPTKTIWDSQNYLIKAVWQEAAEIVVRSKDKSLPVDMDKLREIIPEAKVRSPQVQNNEESYVFYISTKSGNVVTYATELERLLTEDDVKSVISCGKDNLASVKFNGNWFYDMISLPSSPIFNTEDIEAVSEFFISEGIGFSVADNKDNENKKDIVFDEEIPAAEYIELIFELYNKTGITGGKLSAYEGEADVLSEESIEYFSNIKGDANDDGELNFADAVMIMQSVCNPKYATFTHQGKYNADVTGDSDGITNMDALTIQRQLLGLE